MASSSEIVQTKNDDDDDNKVEEEENFEFDADFIKRSYPFLFNPQQEPNYLAEEENEKLRKLRQKKEKKESRIRERNVKTSFKMPEDLDQSYDINKVLEMLGEVTTPSLSLSQEVNGKANVVGGQKKQKRSNK